MLNHLENGDGVFCELSRTSPDDIATADAAPQKHAGSRCFAGKRISPLLSA